MTETAQAEPTPDTDSGDASGDPDEIVQCKGHDFVVGNVLTNEDVEMQQSKAMTLMECPECQPDKFSNQCDVGVVLSDAEFAKMFGGKFPVRCQCAKDGNGDWVQRWETRKGHGRYHGGTNQG